jgi:MFS family permease
VRGRRSGSDTLRWARTPKGLAHLPFTRPLPAHAVYFGSQIVGNLARGLVYTVLAVYYVTVVGLDPLQLVLVGTVLEGTILLLEVPTGLIADVFSRRLTIVAGRVLVGLAFIAQAIVPRFEVIVVAEAVRAAGESCLSGATQAWLADEVGEARIAPLFLRAAQLRIVGYLVGVAGSVALASFRLQTPIVVGGVLTIALGLSLVFIMPERRAYATPHADDSADSTRAALWQKLVGAFALFRRGPTLGILLVVSLSTGAASEGIDRLWEAHLLSSFQLPSIGELEPIVWFGIIQAAGLLLGIGAVHAMRGVDTGNERTLARSLQIAQAIQVVGTLVFALTLSFPLAILALCVARAMPQAIQPLYDTWLTRSAPSHVRATIVSTASQFNAFGQVLGGPIVGVIGRAISLSAALVAAGLLLLPATGVLAGVARQREPLTHGTTRRGLQ